MNITINWVGLIIVLAILGLIGFLACRYLNTKICIGLGIVLLAGLAYLGWYLWKYGTFVK